MNAIKNRASKCTCANIRRGARAVTRLYDEIMAPSGLKVTQFSILRNVMVSGPLNVSELAAILKLDRTTLVRNLKPLETEGFIESVESEDARMRRLAVTPCGRKAVTGAVPYWEKAQEVLRSRLGVGNIENIVNLMMKIESFYE